MPLKNEQRQAIKKLMKQADISLISTADFNLDSTHVEELASVGRSKTPEPNETQFAAASLSKPVFAYLVYKMAKDPNYKAFTLDTPLYTFLEDEKISGNPAHEDLTAKLILSHQSGWPNKPAKPNQAPEFLFEPGKGYAYSGIAYKYLENVIERIAGENFVELAKKIIFDDLKMTNSSFLPLDGDMTKVHAANSLVTTASDYALFCKAAMNEKELFEVTSLLSPERDTWAANQGLTDIDLQKVAWGLGWGLQKNEQGRVTRAFHYGDMGPWRAFVALDLERKTGIVYFSNSPNGLVLADTIISPFVELNDGLKFVFKKFGFARKIEPNWQDNEKLRIDKIIERNMPDLWLELKAHRAASKSVPDDCIEPPSNITTESSHALPDQTRVNLSHRPTRESLELNRKCNNREDSFPSENMNSSHKAQPKTTYTSPTPLPTKPKPNK